MEIKISYYDARLLLDLSGEHPQPSRQPRSPLVPQPPGNVRQQPRVYRDPIQIPPHSHEQHPRPVVLHPRLQPRPQPLPIPIREQVTPLTPHHQLKQPPRARYNVLRVVILDVDEERDQGEMGSLVLQIKIICVLVTFKNQ